MSSNQVNIYVNLCEGDENPVNVISGPKQVEFANSEATVKELAATAKDADALDAKLAEAGIPSVKINPFLARPIDLGALTQVIGDGCILLPSIFGGDGSGTSPWFLKSGQSTSLGVVTTSKGVFYSELTRNSGKGDRVNEGDSMNFVFKSADGRTVLQREMVVEDLDPSTGGSDGGTIIMAAKKCDCFKKIKLTAKYKDFEVSVEGEFK